MLFNSFEFLIFFPIIFGVYYLINHKYRWIFLLVCSYYFYMNWEPIYALLIFLSTLITFYCSKLISDEKFKIYRKPILLFSIISNFGILFLFKYYNFVTNSFNDVLSFLNLKVDFPSFKFLLPVGISFYTFQAVGYSIDVYLRKVTHETHLGKYALFVSFFPQLVAGPIERSGNLIPQFHKKVVFNFYKGVSGMKLIIWGLFMKVVVGDRLGIYVDTVYNNTSSHSSISLILATIFFSFQIYCDFAGYSNIAIGCARILGFDLMTNFKRPYFSVNPIDFWRNWHISLSTWFKDYVYIPLGGSRVSSYRRYLNLFITFLISGLWHGANWTFVLWGALNGFYQIFYLLFLKKLNFNGKILRFIGVILTFILISFSWIFFRANSIGDAFQVVNTIFTNTNSLFTGGTTNLILSITGLSILLIKELYDEFFDFFNSSRIVNYAFYIGIVFVIILNGVFDGGQFIYFQF